MMYFKDDEKVQKITSLIYKTSLKEIRHLTRLVFVINGNKQVINIINEDIVSDN